ncbi:exocyst complex component, exo70 subunit [Laccaria bicolor S238N-H82]|uniref:Exocyst complex protein EXO70 n=1 Tax=Laccaria bicolor (strain S238N-H82 / ATCC MYA-4686) TaxID=486041 RepID=B0DVR4_LACBS|nr:exocyst complex component, exo70 subunit [Laccaria bicolor S238N-H82]EDR01299.1 exocyst complex component, exo70 subunit [Laccaria bicolor S238N-H82]|eukprot:XP_001888006.1 exocyst complex component, exo70 subunit [Laccaria bicolor S238N-H82]
MDDETAEIELLQQNLNKTKQISKRMTTILDSFDTRIAKLEKSILPLYTAAQILNRRRSNIDETLAKINDVASNHEDLAAEEALILRGPQPGQIGVYKDTLERLNANIAFKASDGDLDRTARLIETGAKKLTQLYTKVVAEGSSGVTPVPGADMMTSFPSSLLPTLSPVVTFLRTLPVPSTHPTHPAAQVILTTLKEAQRGYADMRGNWSVKCLEGQGKRLVARAESVDPLVTGREFGEWVELILGTADEEYKLLQELSPLSSTALVASAFGTLLTPILKLFNSILAALVTLVKKSLHRYTFLALSAFEGLLSLQNHWDDLLSRRDTATDKNELKDAIQTLRALCLRSFPEFLADIKLGATSRGSDTSTKLTGFTLSTVRYIAKVPEVRSAVSSALLALGDGNWKMGEGIQVGQAREGDESAILEHFIGDVIITSLTSLTAISRTSRRPAFGSIFLLNNVSYLREHLLIQPTNPSISNLLPQSAVDALNSNFRTAKAGYFDSNFSPLMQALADDPRDKSSKGAAKEKFTRFFDLLDEVVERHRLAKVLEDEPAGRETLGEEVIRLVVPALQRFTQRQKDKDFSKNPQKYIKRSAEEVEQQLYALFH